MGHELLNAPCLCPGTSASRWFPGSRLLLMLLLEACAAVAPMSLTSVKHHASSRFNLKDTNIFPAFLSEGRAGTGIRLLRAFQGKSIKVVRSWGKVKYALAPHFVNETHISVSRGTEAFDTQKMKPHMHPMLVHVESGRETHLSFSPDNNMLLIQHHDGRFYDATQTWFVLSKVKLGKEVRDIVLELDTQGRVTWMWNPSEQRFRSSFPSCMKWTVKDPHHNPNDCHHCNSVIYHHGIVYLSMRRLNGFLAVEKSSGKILWYYSEKDFLKGGWKRIRVCQGSQHLWSKSKCTMFGYHSFHPLQNNVYSIFSNCDASGRLFTIDWDRFCLRPLRTYRLGEESPRPAQGAFYNTPHGAVVTTNPAVVTFWPRHSYDKPRTIGCENQLWLDPVYAHLFLQATLSHHNVVLHMAHNLWLPQRTRAMLHGNGTPHGCFGVQNSTVVWLPEFMGVTRMHIPVHSRNCKLTATLSTHKMHVSVTVHLSP